MNKQTLILASILIIFIIAILLMQNKTKNLETIANNLSENNIAAPNSQNNQIIEDKQITITDAEKIEVIHFHSTQQCWSCIEVGKLALKTIQDKFSEEYNSGKIEFKDINAELPENKEIVQKFQARGSSLFINAIKNQKDNIAEDVTVWRLINSESQFISYFENKLNTLLGK